VYILRDDFPFRCRNLSLSRIHFDAVTVIVCHVFDCVAETAISVGHPLFVNAMGSSPKSFRVTIMMTSNSLLILHQTDVFKLLRRHHFD
jgi:hypothetical protein